mmetsp:Transcript_130005/g.236119  ORF Transcript_130005/g.236119 Transcript_130005/m.236119 type:complete len:94 (-) Transcript_130005:95-376(-)
MLFVISEGDGISRLDLSTTFISLGFASNLVLVCPCLDGCPIAPTFWCCVPFVRDFTSNADTTAQGLMQRVASITATTTDDSPGEVRRMIAAED